MHRRRLLVVVGITLLVATGCVGARSVASGAATGIARPSIGRAIPHGEASPGPSVVPWIDRPAPSFVEPSPSMTLADARSCRPSDLRVVSAANLGAAMSNTLFAVTLRNISGSPCTVIGYPTVSGVDAHGVVHPLTAARGSYFGDPGPPANIVPGDTVRVNVSGGDACQELFDGHHQVYPTLRLGLPSGGTVDVDGTAFDAICGVSVSAFGVPSAASPPADVPLSPLTASISAPPGAAPGTTLRYVVTLTNPTTTAYLLAPCPAYEEYVGSAGPNGLWVGTFLEGYLNCDTVASILPGESVSFAMELALPANQPVSSQVKFGWHLQGDAGPWTAASLKIEQP